MRHLRAAAAAGTLRLVAIALLLAAALQLTTLPSCTGSANTMPTCPPQQLVGMCNPSPTAYSLNCSQWSCPAHEPAPGGHRRSAMGLAQAHRLSDSARVAANSTTLNLPLKLFPRVDYLYRVLDSTGGMVSTLCACVPPSPPGPTANAASHTAARCVTTTRHVPSSHTTPGSISATSSTTGRRMGPAADVPRESCVQGQIQAPQSRARRRRRRRAHHRRPSRHRHRHRRHHYHRGPSRRCRILSTCCWSSATTCAPRWARTASRRTRPTWMRSPRAQAR